MPEQAVDAETGTDDEVDVTDPEAVLGLTVTLATRTFGDRLLAAFAIGSLAHGGFCPQVSDVDAALVLADPITAADPDAIAEVVDAVRARGGLAGRLSLFWSTPRGLATGDGSGRFPAVDRLDLARHGRRLAGDFDLGSVDPPDPATLVVEAVELALAKFAAPDVVAELHDAPAVVAGGARHLTKRVLFPVRFLYTEATGEIGENDAAVDWHLGTDLPGRDLVAAARRWRTDPLEPEAATALVADGLVALWLTFVDRHIAAAARRDRADLVVGLTDWRAALAADPT